MLRLLVAIVFVSNAAALTAEQFAGYALHRQACLHEPFCRVQLTLKSADGREHLITFGSAAVPATLTTIPVSVSGLDFPLLLAIASSPGGSDTSFDVAVLHVNEHSVRELTHERLDATTQDAMFIGVFGGVPGIEVLNFVWADEAHYQPHRYRATRYQWNGDVFHRKSARTTSRKHDGWRTAARALRLKCRYNFIERVLWDQWNAGSPISDLTGHRWQSAGNDGDQTTSTSGYASPETSTAPADNR